MSKSQNKIDKQEIFNLLQEWRKEEKKLIMTNQIKKALFLRERIDELNFRFIDVKNG